MKGRITGISGPTVTVDLKGLKLYDRVSVGGARLMGEVVRLERERAIVQVYEDTRGLGLGEPVQGVGRPLTVRLGPGLLNQMFDGLQRHLSWIFQKDGPFIHAGREAPPAETVHWRFTPEKKPGEQVMTGEIIGCVEEGPFRHCILSSHSGTLAEVAEGELEPGKPVATLEDGTRILPSHEWPVRRPRPYRKKLATQLPLVTGQRCIDFLFPLARGGTAIFPGGFGTGKTILEQSIAKFADTDIVIYVGCGERGNEMAEMLEEFTTLRAPWTDQELMARTVVVVNTSNMPVAAREASIYTAVTMAEYYRDMGYHVLLLADSLSRWAEALREISSALEEMPGEEGYPTYLASRMAEFFARAGVVETLGGQTGSLTMILSVSPPGGDFTEPVTQACLRTTGSFLMLDTSLAHRRHFPAINWFQSFSLYEEEVTRHFGEQVDPRWGELRQQCREVLQREEGLREVAEIVGSEGLQDSDRLLMKAAERIRQEFLAQNAYTEDAFSPPDKTLERIGGILDFYRGARERLAKGEFLDDILKECS
ncbi:ATP synthase subunit A [Desulfuromonas versatilis]|uniref:ATP synthase subunit A n=1 Tax=Desulfuromonas versatilis TaxID=2802975 RepID=A0ABN6DX65_9BACT|nr:V-type ATP synthase subunit A [Desulfuromonas versatilis]BCR04727.1 ATP synthase subunit A [Desulfuromonas versatilis]